ncbi:hypothetical protein BC834DRAFT_569566 [Gloeopeniophorella convolvens]|nr:hypothetical protein BC834DRAFT_569566 [Gloeopeniophorella convolvens]
MSLTPSSLSINNLPVKLLRSLMRPSSLSLWFNGVLLPVLSSLFAFVHLSHNVVDRYNLFPPSLMLYTHGTCLPSSLLYRDSVTSLRSCTTSRSRPGSSMMASAHLATLRCVGVAISFGNDVIACDVAASIYLYRNLYCFLTRL